MPPEGRPPGETRPPSLPEVLGTALATDPDAEIVRADKVSMTRSELERASFALAHACMRAGVVPGTWVPVLQRQGPAAVVGYLGAIRSGAGVAPIDHRMAPAELARLIGRFPATTVVTDAEWAPFVTSIGLEPLLVDVDQLLGEDRPPDPLPVPEPGHFASAAFSSGSTGRPKIIVRRHGGRTDLFARPSAPVQAGAGDRVVVVTPFGPPVPMHSLFGAIRTGAVFCPFDASAATTAELVEFLRRQEISALRVPVGIYRAIVEHLGSNGLPKIREVALGSERIFPSDLDAFRRAFAPDAELQFTYGLGEASSVAIVRYRSGDLDAEQPIRFTTFPPAIRLSVAGPDGEPTPTGELGEIVVRGGPVADGYLDDPALQARKFFTDPDGTKGVRTGDLGRFHPDGSLELAGRADDQVKVRGQGLHLSVVEDALVRLPSVRDCAVVAVPDERDGVKIVAFVQGTDRVPPTVGELRRGLADHLAPHMIPAGFRSLTELPRMPGGKVDRQRLTLEGATAVPRSAPFRDAAISTEAIVRAAFGRVLGYDDPKHEIGCDDDFFELGGNSLAAMELLSVLEQELGVRLEVKVLVGDPTVAGLAAEIERMLRDGDRASTDGFLHFTADREGAPFMLYPGTADSVLHVVPLARRLGVPVHARLAAGVDRPGPAEGVKVTYQSILAEELANARAFADGPLVLGGHSGGGYVAIEVARRLRAEGRTVPLVVLIDSMFPGSTWRRVRQRLATHGGTMPMAQARLTPAAVAGGVQRLVRRKVQGLRAPAPPPSVLGPAEAPSNGRVAALRAERSRLYLEAVNRMLFHQIAPYDGDVLLVVAGRREMTRMGWGADLGWGDCIRGHLSVVTLEADHTSMLEAPDVEQLAEVVRTELVRVGALPT